MKNEEEKGFFKTGKGPDILKLLAFFMFFIFLSIYVRLGVQNQKDNKSNDLDIFNQHPKISSSEKIYIEKSFTEIKNDIISKNYAVGGDIKIADKDYYLLLTKTEDGYNGFFNAGEGTKNVVIRGQKIYEVIANKEEENNQLFETINLEFLDITNIFTLTKNIEPLIKEEGRTKQYTYNTNDGSIVIQIAENKLTKIQIFLNDNQDNYSLSYSYE